MIEDRGNKNKGKVWTVDYDETITAAPDQLARITKGLKAIGDTVVVLTGNKGSRTSLLQQLDDYGIKYDQLIQYSDSFSDSGWARHQYLKQLDAFGAFDNRIDHAAVYTNVCPHFFAMVEAEKPKKSDYKDMKQDAKEAAKTVKRRLIGGPADGEYHDFGLGNTIALIRDGRFHNYRATHSNGLAIYVEQRSPVPPPPNLRASTIDGQSCGTCKMFDSGACWGYGNALVQADQVCDSWTQDG